MFVQLSLMFNCGLSIFNKRILILLLNFAAVQTMAVLIFLSSSLSSKLDRQSHQLLWYRLLQKNFSHIRFCRPNASWLSLLDDFVTTNFGTRAPRARASLEQNFGDATVPTRQVCALFRGLKLSAIFLQRCVP